jgi:hypothetical protein
MLSASLLDCGFHARRTEPVQLLTMAGSASPPVRVHVQMIDNDAAWIDTGTIDFWA